MRTDLSAICWISESDEALSTRKGDYKERYCDNHSSSKFIRG